jgi:hypothetical protein
MSSWQGIAKPASETKGLDEDIGVERMLDRRANTRYHAVVPRGRVTAPRQPPTAVPPDGAQGRVEG